MARRIRSPFRMKLTHNHLAALAWVARTGSLTAAGHALGRTQPALSAQL